MQYYLVVSFYLTYRPAVSEIIAPKDPENVSFFAFMIYMSLFHEPVFCPPGRVVGKFA